jgi:hypothetical protein
LQIGGWQSDRNLNEKIQLCLSALASSWSIITLARIGGIGEGLRFKAPWDEYWFCFDKLQASTFTNKSTMKTASTA